MFTGSQNLPIRPSEQSVLPPLTDTSTAEEIPYTILAYPPPPPPPAEVLSQSASPFPPRAVMLPKPVITSALTCTLPPEPAPPGFEPEPEQYVDSPSELTDPFKVSTFPTVRRTLPPPCPPGFCPTVKSEQSQSTRFSQSKCSV